MSVPKSKRAHSDLIVLVKANELADYTIKLCSKESNFPKRYRWCFTVKIVDCVIDITANIAKANSIRADEEVLKRKRKDYQQKALDNSFALQNYINLSYKMFSIEGNSIEFWTKLLHETQEVLKSWMNKE